MSKNVCNDIDAVAFVQKFRNDAKHIALMLDVPVENILGLAAEESGWGKGRIAIDYNNYFSMHAPAPLQIDEQAAKRSSTVKVAVYSSFLQSGQSFAARFGSAVRGKKDTKAFVQALMHAGYNSGNPKTGGRAGFATFLTDIINTAGERMLCK